MHKFLNILNFIKKSEDNTLCLFGFSFLFYIKKIPSNECYILSDNLDKIKNFLKNNNIIFECKYDSITFYYNSLEIRIFNSNDYVLFEKVLFLSCNFKYNLYTGHMSLICENNLFDEYDSNIELYKNCMNDLINNNFCIKFNNIIKKLLIYNTRNKDLIFNTINYIIGRCKDLINNENKDNINNIKYLYNQYYLTITNNDICPICLEQLSDNICIKLSCNHYLHKDCAISWEKTLTKKHIDRCPYCRKKN